MKIMASSPITSWKTDGDKVETVADFIFLGSKITEQDPVSPLVRLSHQEASVSLLSLSIRGQTKWKPWSQKTNQTDHMDHSLV